MFEAVHVQRRSKVAERDYVIQLLGEEYHVKRAIEKNKVAQFRHFDIGLIVEVGFVHCPDCQERGSLEYLQ